MAEVLYNRDILRLAASIPYLGTLPEPQGRAERRSPVCGSRVGVDVVLGATGEVIEFAQQVHACALGQASAALTGQHALGRTLPEVEAGLSGLSAYLSGACDTPGEWPGLDIFAAARGHPARHASIRLALEALSDAIRAAGGA